MVVRCLTEIGDFPVMDLVRPASRIPNRSWIRRRTPSKYANVEWSFGRGEAGSSLCRTRCQLVIDDDADDDDVKPSPVDGTRIDNDRPAAFDADESMSVDEDVDAADESGVWIPELHLTVADKEALLSGEMLTDKHIFAAQKLLARRAPHVRGLQDPVLSQVGFRPVRHGAALQIHHTQGVHWVVSSWTPGDVVHVYDTLFDFVSEDLLRQLDQIYVNAPRDDDGHVIYVMPPVHKQLGATDCGLFAVALATELCADSDVTKIRFDQSKMRNHLYRCLRKRRMEPFPTEYIEL